MSSPLPIPFPLPEAMTSYFYIVQVCAVCILSCNHPSHHCLAQFRVRMGPPLPAGPFQMAFPVPLLSSLGFGGAPADLTWPSRSPFPEGCVGPSLRAGASGLRDWRPELCNGGRWTITLADLCWVKLAQSPSVGTATTLSIVTPCRKPSLELDT